MTGEVVMAVLSFFLSVLVETVPGFSTFWNRFQWKRMAWLVGSFVVAFAGVLLTYQGVPLGFDVPENLVWDGVLLAVRAALSAYVSGKVTFALVSYRLSDRYRVQ